MALPEAIRITESFQQIEIGTYAIDEWNYTDTTIWKPDDWRGVIPTADLPLVTAGKDGLRTGASTSYSMIYSRIGRATWQATMPSATYPFGRPLRGTVTATAPESNTYVPIGFSIVPCPTRPGRKRLALPGKKMLGRGTLTGASVPPCDLSLQWFLGNPANYTRERTAALSFVVRFPRRTATGTKTMSWLCGVGPAHTKPINFDRAENYNAYNMGAGSRSDLIVFGCGAGFYSGSSQSIDALSYTPVASACLPWVYVNANMTGISAPLPAPTVPGLNGNFYKFEFDRDYHIELIMYPTTGGNTLDSKNGPTSYDVFIDGEKIASTTTANSVGTAAPVVEITRDGACNNSFAFNFHNVFKEDIAYGPDVVEDIGKILFSDIVYGITTGTGMNNTFGPSTRVWGDLPNTDVEASFIRPSGDSNAAVVGAPFTSSAVDPNRELLGIPGQQDRYSTEGSSLPDFAGSIVGVQIKSRMRTTGSSTEAVSVSGTDEVGAVVTLNPSTGSAYTNLDGNVALPPEGITPEAAANLPFGIKVK